MVCGEQALQILELDHVANAANSGFLAPLCANHHAIKSHGAETGSMAALRLRDPHRRALAVQAAFQFGAAAILAMIATWKGTHDEAAPAVFLAMLVVCLIAWGTWNLSADAHLAAAFGDDYDQGLPPAPVVAVKTC